MQHDTEGSLGAAWAETPARTTHEKVLRCILAASRESQMEIPGTVVLSQREVKGPTTMAITEEELATLNEALELIGRALDVLMRPSASRVPGIGDLRQGVVDCQNRLNRAITGERTELGPAL